MKNSYQNKSIAEMITTTEAIKQVRKQMWPPWKNYNLSHTCVVFEKFTILQGFSVLHTIPCILFHHFCTGFTHFTTYNSSSCVLNIDFSTQPFAVEKGATVKQGETLPVSFFIKVLEILWVIINNSEDIRVNKVDQWTQEIRLLVKSFAWKLSQAHRRLQLKITSWRSRVEDHELKITNWSSQI